MSSANIILSFLCVAASFMALGVGYRAIHLTKDIHHLRPMLLAVVVTVAYLITQLGHVSISDESFLAHREMMVFSENLIQLMTIMALILFMIPHAIEKQDVEASA